MFNHSTFVRTFRIALAILLSAATIPSARAFIDLYGNGFDDVWESLYGAQGLTLNGNADNDGQADIFWQNTATGARSLWLMHGTTLSSGVSVGVLSTTWRMAAMADFNGDGKTDIIWQNAVTGARIIWLMNGTALSSTVNLGVVSLQWNIAGAGDFNHDGKPDILWQNNASGACVIWLMNGSTYASSASLPTTATSWKIVGTGDFNGDGKTDILWQNNVTGTRSIWLMNGTAFSGQVTLRVVSPQWNIAGVGDFNNDGKPDILLQNNTIGARQIWLLNGTIVASAVALPAVSSVWQIAGVGNFSGDGISNLQESLAGTDPFNARSGLRITQTQFGTGTVTLRWPSLAGKQYQVLASANPALGNWQQLGGAFTGTGAELVGTFNVTAAQKFFRISTTDLDSDGDGISDWEESAVGLDPHSTSTDGVTNDYQRLLTALQATGNTLTVTELDPAWSLNGAVPGTFTINRNGRLDPLTVAVSFSGNAVAGTDYQPIQNSITLPFGFNSKSVPVTPLTIATHSLTLNLSARPNYQLGTPASATMNLGSPQSNAADAARLLTQSTFGPTPSLLAHAQLVGASAFLNEQFNTATTLTLTRVDQAIAVLPPNSGTANSIFQEAWWKTVVTAPDQIRQRVAFALSEIFVASANGNDIYNYPDGVATYWDLLAKDAFGNFRQLLEDVTLNPVMGDYLDMVHNDKPNPSNNTEPNENYAREVMQLFTIGLYQLNPDGTQKLDNQNQPISTYDQDVVEGFAHVFTGWYWAQSGTPHWSYASPNYRSPMLAFPTHHDTGAKLLLDNVTLPENQTQTKDLKDALDALFNHPNTGPFFCRQLIQRLVTSNPSPAYLGRMAQIFANNGQGVRGDLKAVIKAIFLDPEARSTAGLLSPSYGHEREPLVRLANLYRAFNAQAASGNFIVTNQMANFAQSPLYAPSVFNFFTPNYAQPGAITQAGVLSPEFQITTDTTVITSANKMRSTVYQVPGSSADSLILDLTSLTPLASNPGALVDSLNNLLMSGEMSSAMRDIVVNAVTQIPASDSLERAQTGVHLLVTSPEFVIEK